MSSFSKDPLQGLMDYVQEVKPYHTKLLDVFIQYLYKETFTVRMVETLNFSIGLNFQEIIQPMFESAFPTELFPITFNSPPLGIPEEGDVYYNLFDTKFYKYVSGVWVENFDKYLINEVFFPQFASDPPSPELYYAYFNTTDNKIYQYLNVWVEVTNTYVGGQFIYIQYDDGQRFVFNPTNGSWVLISPQPNDVAGIRFTESTTVQLDTLDIYDTIQVNMNDATDNITWDSNSWDEGGYNETNDPLIDVDV